MTATAIVTVGETITSAQSGRQYVNVTVKCSECSYSAYTGGDPRRDWSHIIDFHLAQHNPGRAIDIEVDWEVVASCSVCTDGGDIYQEGDGLLCRECGTAWDIYGHDGETIGCHELLDQ